MSNVLILELSQTMPRQGKQRKLDDFLSSSPVKPTKPTHIDSRRGEAPKPPSIVSLDSTEDEWDPMRSKLAPSSQITIVTDLKDNDSDASNGRVEMSPATKRRRQRAAAAVLSDVETSG